MILASGSPRRQQFLTELGLTFDIRVADIDETPHPGEAPIPLVRRLASTKAQAVADQLQPDGYRSLIIAADTIVALDNQLLGKPADATEATVMLHQLRNRMHQVYSGVSILSLGGDGIAQTQRTIVNSTDVIMRDYSDEEVAEYVASGDPLDKAGAYAIQHPTFAPAAELSGCFASVMGLPLGDLCNLLSEFGVSVKTDVTSVCGRRTQAVCCQAISIS
ncbi:Maf family protein [Chloroflexi bacterium TSY]|nr:Maf family protein [Chloroflexi bacterium TSY]